MEIIARGIKPVDISNRHSDNPKMVCGSVVESYFVKQAYRNIDYHGQRAVFASTNMPQFEIDVNIIKAAADSYQISSNIEDYVVVPIPIISVDIPNRNLQAFPYEEVSYFDPQHGKMVYSTFVGKGLYKDHDNMNPLKSNGIIVDASMLYVPKYDVWKICIISMWDRTKDKKLVDDILSGKRKGHSMGAMVNNFVCSVCGKIDNMDHTSCQHMQNKGTAWGDEDRLSYQACLGSTFFESSSVEDEADVTARAEDVFHLV